jgi:small subunit ribosomal protein S2
MAVVTMRQLLESGVHFGHQTRRWNPKMKRFIMTERNGIYIIDLQQSLAYIDRSYAFVKDTVAKGGTVMFVGTKKQAQEAIAEQATRVGMPYVNQRWLGGMLTNFQTVHQRINRLKELDEVDFDDVAGSSRTKKELLQMKRERDKLNKTLGGIREMTRTPSAVWIVDTNKEHLAVEEARKLHIPIIGILDSNCDPDQVDFPIPGNDDAIRAVGLLTRVVADAVADGLMARAGVKTGEGDASAIGSEEPLAEWERELLQGDADQAAVAATGGATTAEATPAPSTETVVPAAEATGASSAAAVSDPFAQVPAADPAEVASAVDAPSAVPAEPVADTATDEPDTSA